MSSNFIFWEIVLRSFGVAWGILIAASLALWASSKTANPSVRWRYVVPLMLTFLAWVSYFSCSTAGNVCGASLWFWPVAALNLAFPFALWWSSRVLLGDDTRWPEPWALATLLGLLISGSIAVYFSVPEAAWGQKLFAYGFLVLSFVQIWRGSDGDLIEQRRMLRRAVIGIVGTYSAIVLTVELWLESTHGQPPVWLMWLHLLAMDTGLLLATLWLLHPSQTVQTWLSPVTKPPEPAQATDSTSSLATRALQLMTEKKLHHDSELSLSALATRLVVPQYLLRQAIHEGLGYRNFAAFVNEARLTEVTQRLGDSALDRRPILTLALEAGFGSIGPFNRAFRERFNCSPTEYRQSRGLPFKLFSQTQI
jgi:AraC-like DNA-binding protein